MSLASVTPVEEDLIPELIGFADRIGQGIDSQCDVYIGDVVCMRDGVPMTITKSLRTNVELVGPDLAVYTLPKDSIVGSEHLVYPFASHGLAQHESVARISEQSTFVRPQQASVTREAHVEYVDANTDISTLSENVREAHSFTRELLNGHGLEHWSIEFVSSHRTLGRSLSKRKVIELSVPHIDAPGNTEVWQDTVRHEIAHALHAEELGARQGKRGHDEPHGKRWKQLAKEMGANPQSKGASAFSIERVGFHERLGRDLHLNGQGSVGDMFSYSGRNYIFTDRRGSAVYAIDSDGVTAKLSLSLVNNAGEITPRERIAAGTALPAGLAPWDSE